MSKKALVLTIIVLVFCLNLSGAYASEVKKGGTMVVALQGNPPVLNSGITTDISAINLSGQVFSSIIRLSTKGEVLPYLAKSWEISPDGKVYTFKFYENIQWHDGTPFTSEDVAWSLLNINKKYNALATTSLKPVKSIETPDKHTAVFHMKYAYPPFLRAMGYFSNAAILPKHLYQGTDPNKNPYNFKPIGTGPFIFKEYKKGSHIILEKNPNFHIKGRPYLDRIILQIIPNKPARVLALQKGDVDFLPYYSLPLAEVPNLDKNPKTSVAIAPRLTAGIYMAFLNNRRPPLDKKEVRQALYYALDRQEMLKKAGFGYGKISAGPISSLQPAFYSVKGRQYAHDPKRAEKMLNEAGYPRKENGIRFKLRVSYPTNQGTLEMVAKLMRIYFSKIGVDLKIMPMDSATWRDTAFSKWDFDITMSSTATGLDPAIGTERLYVSSNIRRVAMANPSGYRNPEVDKIFSAASIEIDEKKRAALYEQATKILTEDVPIMWLWDRHYPLAYNAKLKGLPADSTQYGPYDTVWWDK